MQKSACIAEISAEVTGGSFYRDASMQGGLSHKRNVRLSVCPSVKRVNCDKTKQTYVHIITPYERPIHLVF